MATGATAGVKRSRSDVPVYCAHLTQKRKRSLLPRVTDVSAMLKSDIHGFQRFETRLNVLNNLGMQPSTVAHLLRLVSADVNALLALVDLNAYQTNVMCVLADFTTRGASITALNITSHSYCMNDKYQVARSFISANEKHASACEVLKFVIQHVFAQENSASIRVLSGGGVRDILVADWNRTYKIFNSEQTPNLMFITAESGRTFLLPFAA